MTAGQTVGAYRLLRVIGEGGMGVVHLGLDPSDRAVAVKVVRPAVAADPETRARLAREVRSLLRVRHPRVAEVLDADFDAELPYVVMRYVPGDPLDAVVRRDGPLAGPLLDELAVGLFEAVAAVHAVGVVHRDLKPGNVLLLDGSPVVIDFGIARAVDDVALTSTGLMVGTPGYLSPEVLDGTSVGTAADWWGWGAVVAYAATGRAPFRGGPLEAVWDRVRRGAADLEGVDPRWARVLAATLRADPAARPSPEQLADAVASLTGRRPALPAAAVAKAEATRVGPRPSRPAPAAGVTAVAGSTAVQPMPGVAATAVQPRPDADAARPRGGVPAPAATAVQPRPRPARQAIPGPAQPAAWAVAPGQAGHGGAHGQVHGRARGQAPVAPSSSWSPSAAGATLAPAARGPLGRRDDSRREPGAAPVAPLPRRPGTALLGALVVVAVAAVTPEGGAVLVAAWASLARAVQWSRVKAAMSRARAGRLGAGARSGLALMFPVRLLGSLLAGAGYLLVGSLLLSPLLVGGAAALLGGRLPGSWTEARAVLWQQPVPGVLVVVAALLLWAGPGGRAVRHGSRALTEPVARHRDGRLVLAGLATLVAVAAVLVVGSRS